MNYTTYYRKEVWERFKDEPNKAELVNRLLEEHYRKGGGFSEVPVTLPPRRDPDDFSKLKKKLDVREPTVYKKTTNWGA